MNAYYDSVLGSAKYLSTDAVSAIRGNISSTYALMARNSHNIIVLREKLQLLYYIESATANCYSGAKDLIHQVKGIVSELGKAWNRQGGSYTPVKLSGDQVKGINSAWIKSYIQAAKAAGVSLTEDRAEALMELGYNQEKIRWMMSSCENKSDRKFLRCMLAGDYEAAFRVCPFKIWSKSGETGLSDSAKIWMAEFAASLFEEGEEKKAALYKEKEDKKSQTKKHELNADPFGELKTFTEAIYTDLYVDRFPHMDPMQVITGNKGRSGELSSYTAEYLKYLYAGTDINLSTMADYLRSQNFSQRRLEDLSVKQYAYMTMEGYWASQSQLYEKHKNQYNIPEVKISKMTTDSLNRNLSLSLTYALENHKYNTYTLETEVMEVPSDMVDAHFAEDMDNLQQEAENLRKKAVVNGVSDLGLIALSAVAPEAEIPLAAAKKLITGGISDRGDQIYNAFKIAYNRGDQADVAVGHILTSMEDYVDYMEAKSDIEMRKEKLQDDYIDDKFGSGVKIRTEEGVTIVRRGIIDPKEAYLFGRWEREGLSAFTDIDKRSYDEIERRIDEMAAEHKIEVHEDTVKNMKQLLRGAAPGSFDKMKRDAFSEANIHLEEVLCLYEADDRFSISDAYMKKLGQG